MNKMNLYDLNSDKITMLIDGKDIKMIPAICFGKVIDKWLVSKCGKVWSTARGQNKLLFGRKGYRYTKEGKRLIGIQLKLNLFLLFVSQSSSRLFHL